LPSGPALLQDPLRAGSFHLSDRAPGERLHRGLAPGAAYLIICKDYAAQHPGRLPGPRLHVPGGAPALRQWSYRSAAERPRGARAGRSVGSPARGRGSPRLDDRKPIVQSRRGLGHGTRRDRSDSVIAVTAEGRSVKNQVPCFTPGEA